MNNIVFAGKREKDEEIVRHRHKFWEIIYCTARGEIVTEKEKFSYKRGDALVIPPLVRHERSGGSAGEITVWIEHALMPFKTVCVVGDDSEGGLYAACNQAAVHFGGNAGVMAALGDLIVAYVTASAQKAKFSPVVESLADDILKNVSNASYSLEDTIRALPLHYDYVRKLFKKETGITPHEFLVSERMEMARKIIESGVTNQYSAYSVAQIAEMCGYGEPLYFSRVFKKYYGTAPSDYIKSRNTK